jgi:hypothetical protein
VPCPRPPAPGLFRASVPERAWACLGYRLPKNPLIIPRSAHSCPPRMTEWRAFLPPEAIQIVPPKVSRTQYFNSRETAGSLAGRIGKGAKRTGE